MKNSDQKLKDFKNDSNKLIIIDLKNKIIIFIYNNSEFIQSHSFICLVYQVDLRTLGI
jgi:hypothetical protein